MRTQKPGPSEAFLARSRHAETLRRLRNRKNRIQLALALLALLVAIAALVWIIHACPVCTRVADAKYLWVQLMPDEGTTRGGRLVRAIFTEGKDCPVVTQGSNTVPMVQRAPAVRAAFPILLCEAVVVEEGEARVGPRVLPARPDEPNNIVVMGDTGCRMVHFQIQPCRNDKEWRFAAVASSAADKIKLASRQDQSLILHLGDLHYREHQCADFSSLCSGSPFGDNWATWEKDFFEPAKPLLLAAPWVIMRGNHEDCDRAGAGWIFLFGFPATGRSAACQSDLDSYNVSIGKTEKKDGEPQRSRVLLVMDTSYEKSEYSVEARCAKYRNALKELDQKKPDPPAEFWLALHQPLWGRAMNGQQDGEPQDSSCIDGKSKSALPAIRKKFEEAKDKRLARLVLGGDNHAFQFFSPKTGLTPIQIIAGNGGTKLDQLYPLLR